MRHDLEIRDPKRYQRWVAWDGSVCHGCPKYGEAVATGTSESGHTYHIHDTHPKATVIGSVPQRPIEPPTDLEDAPRILFIRHATDVERHKLLINWHYEYEVLGPYPQPLFDGGDLMFTIPERRRVDQRGQTKRKPAKTIHLHEFEVQAKRGSEVITIYLYAPSYELMKRFSEEKIGLEVLGNAGGAN